MTFNADALARAHMAKQVTDAGQVQVALGRLWDEVIDPADLTRSFLRFRELAVPYVMAGRSISEAEAVRYIQAVHGLSDVTEAIDNIPAQVAQAGQVKSSLSASSGKYLAQAEAATSPEATAMALQIAKAQMLASAKRQILNAGRQRITRTAGGRAFEGWARVSDGRPCAFCAMLVSRGPVYDALSVHFAAHDGCGCSARLVTRDDPTRGWSDDARAYRAVWDHLADPRAFRSILTASRTGGESIYADLGPDGPETLRRALAVVNTPFGLAA